MAEVRDLPKACHIGEARFAIERNAPLIED